MGLICTPYGYSGAAKVSGLATYQSTILADKPVAYWPLNAKTQNTDIANGINFTGSGLYTGPALYTGGGASLNTMSQTANLQAPYSAFALQEFSIEFWINTSATSNLVILENNENTGFSVQSGVDGSGPSSSNSIGCNFGSSTSQIATGTLPEGTNFICFSYSASAVGVYLNGKLIASQAPTATPVYSSTSYLNLGSRNGAYACQMYIAGLAVYNTALTAAQILNHYNAGTA